MSDGSFSFLLKGGLVYDGSGGPPFVADIAISGDKIARIGSGLKDADKTIDVSGLALAPGFIDTHGHSEFSLLTEVPEGKVFQGVTTEINGNCGLSAAPLLGEALKQREKDIKQTGRNWSDFEEYFRILEDCGLFMNFATLAGHGNIRASVIGYSNRKPDKAEMTEMKKLLDKAMDAGAIGLSTGLIYPPGIFSDTEELTELAAYGNTTAPGKFIYTSHMRSEGRMLLEAIEEIIAIGRKSGAKAHISHFKTAGKDNWHKVDEAISKVEKERKDGLPLTCDRYPYTAASTDLDAVLPTWTYEGGNSAELERLKNKETREKIIDELKGLGPDWGSIVVSTVTTKQNKWAEGQNILAIASELKKTPEDALIDILVEESLGVDAVFHSMSEDNLKKFLALPYCMLGSDSSARSFSGSGKPHPRGCGSFPRFLKRYAKDLPSGIHKITSLPAETFGITRRGEIREGYFADIVIFDSEKISDMADYDNPFQKPNGIEHVFVNGRPAVLNSKLTGEIPGKILRHGG